MKTAEIRLCPHSSLPPVIEAKKERSRNFGWNMGLFHITTEHESKFTEKKKLRQTFMSFNVVFFFQQAK
jgi:hypothetical protein